MGALSSRRGGFLTLVLVAAALVAAATFLILQFADRPQVAEVSPPPGAAVATASPALTFAVDGDRRLSGLRVTVAGRDVTGAARARDGIVHVPLAGLADGAHEVEVSFGSRNVFARSVSHRWSFDVDTVPPRLSVTAPRRGQVLNRAQVRFTGISEPGVEVTVAHADRSDVTRTGPRGGWTMLVPVAEGLHPVTVTAADRAGNVARAGLRVGVDTTAPTVEVSAPAAGEKLTATDEPLLYGRVRDDNPRALAYALTVNGRPAVTARGTDAARPDDDSDAGFTEAGAGEPAAIEIDGRRFALAPGVLAQGRNRVELRVTDRAGNTARVVRQVIVDSTDEFGEKDMMPGASGGDVADLQERLKGAGVFPKRAAANGVYDRVTVKAVRRYQRMRSLPVTGQVDARMRSAMVGRIVVNLGARRLSLIRDGKVWKSYPIAVGAPGFATPTGTYEVIQKQVDPTWFPPSSPWAAGLGPIPPGPGNPLGTRWIGTSAPAIGIHGTYASSSIGTAASHGCMRMHIPDVEELYEEVSLGMKVIIKP